MAVSWTALNQSWDCLLISAEPILWLFPKQRLVNLVAVSWSALIQSCGCPLISAESNFWLSSDQHWVNLVAVSWTALSQSCSCFLNRAESISLLFPDCSFPLSYVSESLRSLTKNEQLWAICSGCSEGMSYCEQIAQVAHQKLANEQMAHTCFLQKTSDSLRKPMSEFPTLPDQR